MSFPPPGAGAPGSGFIYTSASGYSSPSDLDSSASHNIYSDTEAGYSSAASASFDSSFNVPGFVPSYASQRYPPGSSQSPPAQGAGGNNMGGSNGGSQQYQRIARFVGPPPVALACTECRSRHLKCDAGTPTCSRCAADKRECSYVKSRRGWKGTRRKKVAAAGKGGTTDTETASKSAAVSATEVEGNTGTQGKLASRSFFFCLSPLQWFMMLLFFFTGVVVWCYLLWLRLWLCSPRRCTFERRVARDRPDLLFSRGTTAAVTSRCIQSFTDSLLCDCLPLPRHMRSN
ncbi:hypothetical protein EDC01DRAFT_182023 [Geopyxis carbonaria]|nr:hypothetical protein EDC01DRAFT_182023 [Geopyxis carbonaria]